MKLLARIGRRFADRHYGVGDRIRVTHAVGFDQTVLYPVERQSGAGGVARRDERPAHRLVRRSAPFDQRSGAPSRSPRCGPRYTDETEKRGEHVLIIDLPAGNEPVSGEVDLDAIVTDFRAPRFRGVFGLEYRPSLSDARFLAKSRHALGL